MELTKYNTSLDIRRLSNHQFNEIIQLTKGSVLFGIKKSIEFPFLVYSKPCNMVDPEGYMGHRYTNSRHCEGLNLIDFNTFKSIHFPDVSDIDVGDIPSSRRQEDDTPSYEDLVEALRLVEECIYGGYFIQNTSATHQKIKKLLERIK